MSRSTTTSAGLLPYRTHEGRLEVFIAHMGGPFWAKKDATAWSIVKGECDEHEDPLDAARREFREETGNPPPDGEMLALGEVRQAGGKLVIVWAVAGEIDPATVVSNTFTMQWPPRSGREQEFPEIDRAQWFSTEEARGKLVRGQVAFIGALEQQLR